MKIRIGKFEKESFTSGVALVFENELVLRTNVDLAWCGIEKKQEVIEQVKEVVAALKSQGCEIENEGDLDDF